MAILEQIRQVHNYVFCVDATSRPAGITVIWSRFKERRPRRQNKGEPSSCLAPADDVSAPVPLMAAQK